MATRFRSLFERVKHDVDEGNTSVYTKAASVAETLLSTQRDLGILHGDIHHENVKHSGKRGWLAIDPKGLYGERTYDTTNVLCNPIGMDDFVANEARLMKNTDLLATELEVPMRRLLAFTFVIRSCGSERKLVI